MIILLLRWLVYWVKIIDAITGILTFGFWTTDFSLRLSMIYAKKAFVMKGFSK